MEYGLVNFQIGPQNPPQPSNNVFKFNSFISVNTSTRLTVCLS